MSKVQPCVKCEVPFSTALSVYFAYAHSWLRYGVLTWGKSTDAHDLFVAQKKCIRILTGIRNRVSCRPYFKEYGILTLPCLYIYELGLFARRNLHRFKKQENKRFRYKLIVPPANLQIFKKSPEFAAIKCYNHIPDHIKAEEKDERYQEKLKKFLNQKCYYDVKEFFESKPA